MQFPKHIWNNSRWWTVSKIRIMFIAIWVKQLLLGKLIHRSGICVLYVHILLSPEAIKLPFLMDSEMLVHVLIGIKITFNPLNTELNSICHLLALVGARHIVHVSKIRVNPRQCMSYYTAFKEFPSATRSNTEHAIAYEL